jgi:hypothetical protein
MNLIFKGHINPILFFDMDTSLILPAILINFDMLQKGSPWNRFAIATNAKKL